MKARTFLSFLILAMASVLSLGAHAGYSFAVTSINVTEGGPVVNLAVTRTAPLTGIGTVAWATTNGTAVAGTDFGTLGNSTPKSGTLTWAANVGGIRYISVGAGLVPVINNPAVENTKSFTIGLSAPTNGEITGNPQVEVNIIDVDHSVSFEGTNVSVNENGPNTVLTLYREGSLEIASTVTYTTTHGTTTAADVTLATGTITFAIGEAFKNIAVGPTIVPAPYIRVMNDALVEGPETFTVTLTTAANGPLLVNNVATVTILSDENGVSMGAATRSFAEGAGNVEVMVNRSGSTGAVDVNYTVNNGTAVNGTHFETNPTGTLHWDSGETGAKPILVNIADNEGTNTTRTFSITLSGATGATIPAPATTTVSITDNDNAVEFTLPTATVVEGTANLALSVKRTGSAAASAQVTWTAVNGSAIAGSDFGVLANPAAPTGTLTWAAGDAASKPISIPILNDTSVEGAQTFTVVLSDVSGANASIGANQTSTVTLNDNDKGFAFVNSPYSVTEGAPGNLVTITVSRIGPATTAASLTWATSNGSAIAGEDFGTLNSAAQRTGTLSWAANDALNKTFTIPIINDTIGGEGPQTFNVTVTPAAGYVMAGDNVAVVTINDNDIPPESYVQFNEPKVSFMENAGTAIVQVDRVLQPGGSFALGASVNYATAAGTALATSDYITKTGVLTWTPGDSESKTIMINLVNNAVVEGPEAFRVVLSGATPGLGLGTPSDATVLINDDDEVFPPGGIFPMTFYDPAGVDASWHISNDPGAFEGVLTLKSDQIDNSQSAGIALVANFTAAGNVAFRVKVSTEASFDVLRFYIDDVEQGTGWSGNAVAGWTLSPNFPITTGVHHLKWVYTKDGSVTVGSDAVFIDALTLPAHTPLP